MNNKNLLINSLSGGDKWERERNIAVKRIGNDGGECSFKEWGQG